PPEQTIIAGQNASYNILLTRTNFDGEVNLSVSGLPNGITAKFNPNPATGTESILTITTIAGVPAARYPIQITGTASGQTVSTNIGLTVTKAGASLVTLSATPATQTITAGESTSYTVMLDRTNYAGNIDLSLNGLPAGASASFSPAQTSGNSSTLSIDTSSSA